ncbi:MAG: LamG domain-containing protein, partial [Cyclobacteriaceae bacterium]
LSNYNGSVNSDGNCSDKNGFNFGISDQGQLQITYATNGNAYIGRRTEPNSLGTEWTHVAGVWNGTKISSGFKLYINGEQEDTIDYELGSLCGDYLISALPFNIGIGNCQAGLCQPYDGSLDDVRIYNKVFENTEIKKLYEIEKEGME